jgi:hypothetical protein
MDKFVTDVIASDRDLLEVSIRVHFSLISFLRHEGYSFWNVNVCSLVDRSVTKESYASTFSTDVCNLKMPAPLSSKRKKGITTKKIVDFVFTGLRSISHAYLRH